MVLRWNELLPLSDLRRVRPLVMIYSLLDFKASVCLMSFRRDFHVFIRIEFVCFLIKAYYLLNLFTWVWQGFIILTWYLLFRIFHLVSCCKLVREGFVQIQIKTNHLRYLLICVLFKWIMPLRCLFLRLLFKLIVRIDSISIVHYLIAQ